MSDFITISYRKVNGSYFPSIVSDEAMTSSDMKAATGACFEEPHISIHRDGMFQRFWHLNDLIRTRGELVRRQIEKNTLSSYIDIVNKHFDSAIQVLDFDFSNSSSTDLWSSYSKACSEYRNICVYAYSANLLDKALSDSVTSGLSELLPDLEKIHRDEYILKLTRNPAANLVYNHDLELIALIDASATEEQVTKHVDKWKTLFNGAEDVRNRMSSFRNYSKSELEDLRLQITEQYSQAEADIKQAEDDLSIGPELIDMFSLLRGCILLKETRKFCMTRLEDAIVPLFNAIGRAAGIDSGNVAYLLPGEIEEALLKGSLNLTNDSIEAFKDDLCYVIQDGITKRVIGAEVDKAIQDYDLADEISPQNSGVQSQPATAQSQKEYKGFVSCLGCVEGPVKLVFGKEDFHKVEQGDILVTPITTPEYLAVFGLVSGMITFDGGGITSHPATLSREYKIPAILGIKDLSGVLKDNDRVLVDANNNVVKILHENAQ